ncbi:N-acetylmuramoyl-L-alanine amidase [Streptomonospora salina]|uniref:N-acetylmuramoyl-L-alanine amidase n=1 Tax=Streptomonospora salina TaxID=104205 RepID=A0A841EIW1_9ACTN|nr:N-acetylmuramoyl-L-alanine amidase [Streptomonospora salina]MBB6001329.1 hypothetical protein [Streptomonospora salina]
MATVPIIERSQWGARDPRGRKYVSWGTRTEFIVHHSAGPTSQTVRSIQDFHMDSRGWSDIGYNLLVDDAGHAYDGRGWLVVGAHAVGHNTSGIGVCYIGQNAPTDPAKRTIRALYDMACEQAGRQLETLGHGDVNDTTCPGGNLDAWVHDGMPVDGLDTNGGHELIGLKKGDQGERVKGLQVCIMYAGVDLPQYGADGDYGDETAEGLRQARELVGSDAGPGYGDRVSGWAYGQLMKLLAENTGGDGTASLPDTISVSGDLDVED